MRRGTTPTITLNINGLTDIEYSKIMITFKQNNHEVVKTEDEISVDGNTVSVTLAQSDTLSFNADPVNIQARILSSSGTAYATNIIRVPVYDILTDGEINAES